VANLSPLRTRKVIQSRSDVASYRSGSMARSGPALRRAAEYGDGWYVSPAEAGSKIGRIEQVLSENGGKRSDLEIAVSPYTQPLTVDDLKRYRDAGADEVELIFLDAPNDERDVIRQLESLAREFVEPASKL
jgi:alkanesulfonate monooxygenase SsuD/methylene tetrahydromethanopterin reductase-like flavin-dependent oxidoreductase (luciferase family)